MPRRRVEPISRLHLLGATGRRPEGRRKRLRTKRTEELANTGVQLKGRGRQQQEEAICPSSALKSIQASSEREGQQLRPKRASLIESAMQSTNQRLGNLARDHTSVFSAALLV